MNASHAFYLHNRKYYFNAIKSTLEPIYYDGNANFLSPLYLNQTNIELISSLPSVELSDAILGLNHNDKLLDKFLRRTLEIENSKKLMVQDYDNNWVTQKDNNGNSVYCNKVKNRWTEFNFGQKNWPNYSVSYKIKFYEISR